MQSRSRPVRRRQVLGGAAALLASGASMRMRLPTVEAGPGLSFTPTSLPTGNSPYWMGRGDINEDFYDFPDLVIANSGDSTLTFLLNSGTGAFAPATNSPFPVTGGAFRVGSGDFFGTGKPAIAVFGLNAVSIFPNNTVPGSSTITLGTPVVTPLSQSAFAIGDLNRDGKEDLVYFSVTGATSGTVNILYGKGDGTFRVGPSWAVPTILYSLALHDLNGDGFAEVVGSRPNSGNFVHVWEQTPNNGWVAAAGSPYPTSGFPGAAAIATLGSGQPPTIAVPCYGPPPTVNLFRCGSPYAHPFLTSLPSVPTVNGPGGLTFADCDGTGKSLCVTSTDNLCGIHTPNPGGGFNSAVTFTDPSVSGPFALKALTLDNSGKSSLAMVSDGSKKVTFFRNTTAYTPTLTIFDTTRNGPLRGGNTVIIDGAGFQPGDTVFFGGAEATSVAVLDGGTIYATVPDVSYGSTATGYDTGITINSPDGRSAYSPNRYVFFAIPSAPIDPGGPPGPLPPPQQPGPPGGNPPPLPIGRGTLGGPGVPTPSKPPDPLPPKR